MVRIIITSAVLILFEILLFADAGVSFSEMSALDSRNYSGAGFSEMGVLDSRNYSGAGFSEMGVLDSRVFYNGSGDGIWITSWSGYVSQMNDWAINVHNHGIEAIYFNVGAPDPITGMLIENHIYQYETEIVGFIDLAHTMGIAVVASLGGVNDSVDFGNQTFRENIVDICQTLVNPPYVFDGLMMDIEPIPDCSDYNPEQEDGVQLEKLNNYISLLELIKNATDVNFLGTVAHPVVFNPAFEGAPTSNVVSDWNWTEETYQYIAPNVDKIEVMAYLDCQYYDPELFDYGSYIYETISILAPLVTPVTKLNIGIASYLDNLEYCDDLYSQTLENGLIGAYNSPEYSSLNGLSIFRYNNMDAYDWEAWDNAGPDDNQFESGDINGDFEVNIQDILLMINMILPNGDESTESADINGDGVVNVLDVLILMNIILGL